MSDDKQYNVDIGTSMSFESKRGTGTRDYDKVTADVEVESLEELEHNVPKVMSAMQQAMRFLRQTDDFGRSEIKIADEPFDLKVEHVEN